MSTRAVPNGSIGIGLVSWVVAGRWVTGSIGSYRLRTTASVTGSPPRRTSSPALRLVSTWSPSGSPSARTLRMSELNWIVYPPLTFCGANLMS